MRERHARKRERERERERDKQKKIIIYIYIEREGVRELQPHLLNTSLRGPSLGFKM